MERIAYSKNKKDKNKELVFSDGKPIEEGFKEICYKQIKCYKPTHQAKMLESLRLDPEIQDEVEEISSESKDNISKLQGI